MHDQSEDSYLLSPYRISLNFGIEIALNLRAITKLPSGKESTKDYLLRIVNQGSYVIVAKLLDRLDNLRDLHGCTEEKRIKQIEETKQFHIPILISALKKQDDIWQRYANILEEKINDAIKVYD